MKEMNRDGVDNLRVAIMKQTVDDWRLGMDDLNALDAFFSGSGWMEKLRSTQDRKVLISLIRASKRLKTAATMVLEAEEAINSGDLESVTDVETKGLLQKLKRQWFEAHRSPAAVKPEKKGRM